MKLINTIKKVITEKLGVPDNILEVAEDLYKKILKVIPNSITIEDLVEETFTITDNFDISDMSIDTIYISFEFFEHDKNMLAGMSHSSEAELTKDLMMKSVPSDSEVKIKINIAGDKNMVGKNVKKILKDNSNQIMSVLSHELKHAYDNYKKPYENLKSRTHYALGQNFNLGAIQPINKFINYCYFIHEIENLVRPTEFASLMKSKKINKKDFYKFITENELFKKLNQIKNFTYEKLLEELKNDIPEIKEAFDVSDINYDEESSDEEIIDKLLKLFMINVINFKSQFMREILTTNFIEQFIGLSGEKQKFFDSFVHEIMKYKENYKGFIKKEEKHFKIVADNVIRKISKLYDLAIDNEPNEIKEITLVYDDVNNKTKYFDTELKYIPKKLRHPIIKKTSK
jgi:hypothetical protein